MASVIVVVVVLVTLSLSEAVRLVVQQHQCNISWTYQDGHADDDDEEHAITALFTLHCSCCFIATCSNERLRSNMSVMEATTSMATTTVMEEATTATAGAPSSSTSTSTKRRRVARPPPLLQDILGDGSGPSSSSSNAKWVCSYNGCNKSFQRSDHLA